MKVLIVARYKERGFAPFVTEQVAALEKEGVECRFFPVKGGGLAGYLKQLPALCRSIRENQPDLVHAHYGLCGLLAGLQRRVPVVTTFHGSDINDPGVRSLSRIAARLSRFNVFVSGPMAAAVASRKPFAVIPCGIDLEDYPEVSRSEARSRRGLAQEGKYVLFAGAFDNAVKNASLAKAAVGLLPGVELLELKGYSRQEVALLMHAADAFLMTSDSEGSPQVIKEALACGCPIVSVDVGDVRERVKGVDGCFIAQGKTPEEIAALLESALAFGGRTTGRKKIVADKLDNRLVAKQIIGIYESL
jgi:glycosyltransferase involved in cell wall biosynthesis